MFNSMLLSQVSCGEECVIQKITAKTETSRRLTEMGIGRGCNLQVERVAPLGDPIAVKVKSFRVSIRKEDAQFIVVEV